MWVGSIPIWNAPSLPHLVVLSLCANELHSAISDELCSLTILQILDLEDDTKMFPKFDIHGHYLFKRRRYQYRIYIKNAFWGTKAREVKYNTVLGLITSLDLSSNMIFGEISEELTSLICLQSLNFSNNLHTGRIPSKINDIGSLESFDYHANQLSGEISPSISNLTFLHYLNLSYNNLIAQMPKSTQLQSFDLFSYAGNKLCGAPLEDRCSTNEAMPPIGSNFYLMRNTE